MISRLVLAKRRWRRRISRTRWISKLLGRKLTDAHSNEPGLLIIQIDGLPRSELEKAFAQGQMPFLSRLHRTGHFELVSFYSGIPSTTPAVQAEMMFGQRCAVPAFQYMHRATGQMVMMFEQRWAKAIGQELLANNETLLVDGRSYCNIYAAGASEALLCAEKTGFENQTFWALLWKLPIIVLLYSLTILRIVGLALVELMVAMFDFVRGILGNQDIKAEFHCILSRIGVSIVAREWLRVMYKVAVAEGAPIIYGNFLGYDEQAHRRGPDSHFAHWVLRGIDRTIRDIIRTAQTADVRDYEIIVLSDHGQQRVNIFDTEQGLSIHEAVKKVFGEDHSIDAIVGKNTRHRETDLRSRHMLRSNGRSPKPEPDEPDYRGKLLVTALGPLGHVYLPHSLDDGSLAEGARKLVSDYGVPLVIYKTQVGGLVAENQQGTFHLPQDIQGILGTSNRFASEIAADLVLLSRHPDCGDLIVSGWNQTKRPITFVQENGAHGSLGPEEVRGFALIPHGIDYQARHADDGEIYVRGVDIHSAAKRFLGRGSSPLPNAVPSHQRERESDTFRVMTYNIHSCIGADNKLRPERIVSVIRSCKADIICLQEVDMNRFRTARQEQSAVIATALSMSHHFYAVGDWGTEKYGLAVISRFPLVHIQSGHLTPANSAQRAEARGALWVSIQSPFGKLNVINTHFGLKREERQRQADILLGNDWLGNVLRDEPVIVCGDFNAQPRSQVWKTFCRHMRDAQQAAPNHRPRNTFASIFPAVRIDHIFVNEKLSVKSIQQPRTPTSSVASDHLPICAELKTLAFPPTGK